MSHLRHEEPDRLVLERLERIAGANSAEIKKIICCVDPLNVQARIRAEIILGVGLKNIEQNLISADLPLIDLNETSG